MCSDELTLLLFLLASEELNRVVSEAFLLFFVKTVGHYMSYVKYHKAGEKGVFEKKHFCKAIESKATRHFVKKFIQTQMFDLFIQEVEQQQPGPQQGELVILLCWCISVLLIF